MREARCCPAGNQRHFGCATHVCLSPSSSLGGPGAVFTGHLFCNSALLVLRFLLEETQVIEGRGEKTSDSCWWIRVERFFFLFEFLFCLLEEQTLNTNDSQGCWNLVPESLRNAGALGRIPGWPWGPAYAKCCLVVKSIQAVLWPFQGTKTLLDQTYPPLNIFLGRLCVSL